MPPHPHPQHTNGGKRLPLVCRFYRKPPHAGDNYIVVAHPNPAGVAAYRFYTEADAIASGSNPNNLPLNKINTLLIFPNHNKTTTSPGNPPIGYAFLTIDPYQKYYHTSILTVWRTLWVECDYDIQNYPSV